ncbi:MAG: VCBS repeat-containing protein [Marinisporobacter sp.]|nr:VCBS repeat-containing protein [Marinisporobacter sp.]
MYYYPMYFQKKKKMNNKRTYILDFKQGDVNGDGIIDYVYLVGEKPYGSESPFRENITLKIIDGRTKCETTIPLKVNAGYGPSLFLGDFTGNQVDNIYISIFSGGSGGYTFYYIYSFLNNEPKLIFDFEKFNDEYEYDVNYKDDYKVEVISKNTHTKYLLDIQYKGEEYLSEIYDENGKLKKPIDGWVNPLGGLYPIDFQGDGTYELYAEQRIAGRYNADGLGYVQTSLKWDGEKFIDFFQTVGIFGEEINMKEKD